MSHNRSPWPALLVLCLGFFVILLDTTIVNVAIPTMRSNAWMLAVPFAVAGLGMGCMLAPAMTEAMREVGTVLAAAASGVLNTSRQVGAAVGAAVIGAVLQNRLASAMHDGALADAAQIPPQYRAEFVSGFATAAKRGFEVGRGQSGGVAIPAGLPPDAVRLVQQLALVMPTRALEEVK